MKTGIHTIVGALAVAAVLGSCATLQRPKAAAPAPLEKDALAHVERLRAVKPAADARQAELFNKQLEDAWKYFAGNRAVALPVLRRELAAELKKNPRNDFILLDLGYFLYQHGEPADKELARSALYALNVDAEILRFNLQELFQFAHAVSRDRDARILNFLDRAFLARPVTVKFPEHSLALDEALVCVLLYGAYGTEAENHLMRRLVDRRYTRKILETLAWIGSTASNAEVKLALDAAGRDYETFVRAATFLMTLGGPQGRRILLGVNARELDAKTQEYYTRIRRPVEAASYAELAKQFPPPAADMRLPDAELRKQLAAMNSGYGKDVRVAPGEILHSGLPRTLLMEELMRARTHLLRRVSAGALNDVRRTNVLINALAYRER